MAQLSNTEAQRYSGEHLIYEVEMLFLTSEMLLTLQPVTTVRENTAKNALIEAFALHLRALVDFVDDVGSHADDVMARDFVADRTAWEAARPELPADLVEASGRRTNKEVVHITSNRIYGTPAEKGWDVRALRGSVADRLRIFIRYADGARLNQHFVAVFDALTGGPINLDLAYPGALPLSPETRSSSASVAVLRVGPIAGHGSTDITTP